MDEESIKIAFSKVKYDINSLQNEILSSKQSILEQNEIIESLKSKISELKDLLIELKSRFSIGNEGVQSINHSTINQSSTEQSIKQPIQSINQTENTNTPRGPSSILSTFSKVRELNEALSKTFQSLTNQEFKVFLMIYQIEDEHGRATYSDLALKTSLTSGCIRGYVSSLIQKGAPVVKIRQKNNQATLTIDDSFKSLGLKEKLINLYYQQDPQQTTLFPVK